MILVFGTVCLDRVRTVPHLPEKGRYVEVLAEQVLLGGEAANTALALKTWGADVALFGNSLGSGDMRALLQKKLHEAGLEGQFFEESVPTPVCDIYVTPDGERTMFGVGFAQMDHPADLSLLPYRAGAWFTTDLNTGSLGHDAVRKAAEQGMRIYVMDFVREDAAIPEGCIWQSSTDWAGTPGSVEANLEWVQRFSAVKRCFAILSDGSRGLVAGSPEHPPRHYPSFPCPNVLDTTGAGDVFRAGMLFGFDQDWPVSQCLRFAAAAGCLACSSLGATTAVPTREQIESHIAANPATAGAYD